MEVTFSDGSKCDLTLEFVASLGKGRAAEVLLVRDPATGKRYAEKIFKSSKSLSQAARNLLYGACFQAPPPYQTKESAVKAALYRRRVLRGLSELWFGRPMVADAVYTRWDESARAYVLGTEYIEGRGPKPGDVNCRRFRQAWHNGPVRLFKWLTRSHHEKDQGCSWEIAEATRRLDEFKAHFRKAGFIGSEWQVEKALSVPTSNLRRDRYGDWILIDVESAYPALISPRSIWSGLKYGALPLFDDVDFRKLHRYLLDHWDALIGKLGEARAQRLCWEAQQLEHFTRAWKDSEPAALSHRHRLLTDSRLRSNIRHTMVEHWLVEGRISPEIAEKLKASSWLFLGHWALEGGRSLVRIPLFVAGVFRAIGLGIAGLARSTWRLFHAMLFDEAQLREMARSYARQRIDGSRRSGRLTEAEATRLEQDLESPATIEYLKGAMVHVGFQAIEPPFIGDAGLTAAALYFDAPEIMAGLLLSPALRTGYTLYRMAKNRGSGISYRHALVLGMFPHVGVLAYPAQISAVQPELSAFLARHQMSRIGCRIPLFGGLDSRLDHFLMKQFDWLASVRHETGALAGGVRRGLHLKSRPVERSSETCAKITEEKIAMAHQRGRPISSPSLEVGQRGGPGAGVPRRAGNPRDTIAAR